MRIKDNGNHVLLSLFIIFYCTSFHSCTEKAPISRRDIKVLFTDFPSNLCDESGKLSNTGRALFDELQSEENKCIYTFILDPLLVRPDLALQHSIVTKIEKSGVSDVSNPNVVAKLVKMNLEELVVPEPILQKTSLKADSLFNSYILNEAKSDSLIVIFKDSKQDVKLVDGKQYKVFNDISEIRSKILSILCQDSKASIALLINPISLADGPIIVKPTSPTVSKPISPTNGAQITDIVTTRKKVKVDRVIRDNGDLTIIKGSEGCDICTRYYSATDNLGRTRQVSQKNSTECCPCGKTIEMKGRTYRMECEGSSNRLSLVE